MEFFVVDGFWLVGFSVGEIGLLLGGIHLKHLSTLSPPEYSWGPVYPVQCDTQDPAVKKSYAGLFSCCLCLFK